MILITFYAATIQKSTCPVQLVAEMLEDQKVVPFLGRYTKKTVKTADKV